MTFSMQEAQVPGNRYNREKIDLGAHVCRLLNVRIHNGFKGKGFFIDFEVVSGNTPAGTQSSFMVYPDKARGYGKMTDEQARAKDLGKMMVAVAACYGHKKEDSATVTQAVFDASVSQPSPLAGRLIVVNCVGHTNQQGKQTSYYEILPFTGEQAVAALESKPTAAAPKTAPAFKKAAAPAFPPAGWELHPEKGENGEIYYFNDSEVVEEAELRARG